MKTLTSFVCVFVLCITTSVTAQELLVGGNMQDSTAWKVSHLDSDDISEYEFNYLADGPAEGKDGCLEVTCSGTQSTNILFFQEVTLTGGAEYEVKGAFKDLTGSIANFWCEVLWDTITPPDSVDFGGNIIVGFNTWDGTQPGIDGNFQDDYSKGPGPIFMAPGEAGLPIKIYFTINVGCWTGGTSYFFDVAIDEMSLMPVGGIGVEDSRVSVVDQFDLHQNYPNPFNPTTTIWYSIPSTSQIRLAVYDVLGREVAVLMQSVQNSGRHEVSFSGAGLASGIYFYKLQTADHVIAKKMMLQK